MKTNIIRIAVAIFMAILTTTANAQQNNRQQNNRQQGQDMTINNKSTNNKKSGKIEQSNLPQQSQTTINNYFPSNTVKSVKQNTKEGNSNYEVKFQEGSSVQFDEKGNWTSVTTSNKTTVPADMVPNKINKYITQKYSNQKIKKLEKRSDGGYNVTLANGVALVFSAVLNFVSASK